LVVLSGSNILLKVHCDVDQIGFLEDEKKFDPEEVYKGQPNPTKI